MTSTTSRLIAATDSSSQAGKTLRKALLIGVMLVTVFLVAGISMTIGWRPIIGAKTRALTTRNFERTPQRLERGRYIFMGLSRCVHCHSPLEGSQRGFPPVMSLMGSGQVLVDKASLGRIVAPNLTPDMQTGSGAWTDDQLARAIREGIGHDGRTLFPLMPYENFRHMSDEDLASVIVYLRTLPAVRNPLPHTEIIFPMKYLMRNAPQPINAPVPAPNLSDQVKRGEYLVRLASCGECHTPQEKGQPKRAMEFAGGN